MPGSLLRPGYLPVCPFFADEVCPIGSRDDRRFHRRHGSGGGHRFKAKGCILRPGVADSGQVLEVVATLIPGCEIHDVAASAGESPPGPLRSNPSVLRRSSRPDSAGMGEMSTA